MTSHRIDNKRFPDDTKFLMLGMLRNGAVSILTVRVSIRVVNSRL